jgi:hypothetical protein
MRVERRRDPRDDYRDAMEHYARSRDELLEVLKLIRAVANGLEFHIAAFLAANFDIPAPGCEQQPARSVTCDLRAWPDRAELRQLVTQWHQAFSRMHEAWSRMSPADRRVSHAPPEAMWLR